MKAGEFSLTKITDRCQVRPSVSRARVDLFITNVLDLRESSFREFSSSSR